MNDVIKVEKGVVGSSGEVKAKYFEHVFTSFSRFSAVCALFTNGIMKVENVGGGVE
jgi:hypothetical protein